MLVFFALYWSYVCQVEQSSSLLAKKENEFSGQVTY